MEWVSATPAAATTSLTSSATLLGDVTYSRVPGASGNTLLRCAPTLEFDVEFDVEIDLEIDLETADGVLDERWDERARGLQPLLVLGTFRTCTSWAASWSRDDPLLRAVCC